MGQCSKCGKPSLARGLCRNHYYQQWRRGMPPLEDDRRTTPIKERLLSKVVVSETGCHLFTGSLSVNGYGLIWENGSHSAAHRVAYRLCVGPLTDDDIICHRCDVRNCVNPDHLFKGTREQNNLDMRQKDRHSRGARSPHAKLTSDQVDFILSSTASDTEIAKRFGVNQSTIWRIRNGQRWKHRRNYWQSLPPALS